MHKIDFIKIVTFYRQPIKQIQQIQQIQMHSCIRRALDVIHLIPFVVLILNNTNAESQWISNTHSDPKRQFREDLRLLT